MNGPDYVILYNNLYLLGCWYMLLDLIKVFWEKHVEQIRIIWSNLHLVTRMFVDGSNKERVNDACFKEGCLLYFGVFMFLFY